MARSSVESSAQLVVGLEERTPIRVLHVDDEVGLLKVTKQLLEADGDVRVMTVSSVDQALEKLKNETYDVVVSDYMMPGKDGLEFLKILRDSGNDAPFIIFTGKGREEVAIKALNLGADQYVNKLGDPETVYAELAHSIRKAAKTVTVAKDKTGSKKAEQIAHESRQKFEGLFKDNPEAAVYLSPDFRILDINPRFCELFGFVLGEVKGQPVNDVIVPCEKAEEAKSLDERAEKGYVYHDTVRKRKDGSLVQVSVSAAPIVVEDRLVGHVALYKDISKLKRTEAALIETMEKLATMNEKLRVVGSLTRHDVRNKLSVVTGNSFLVKRKLAGNSQIVDYMNEIESACWKVSQIFDFARNYEMLGVEELTYMDAEKTIAEATQLFSDLRGVVVANECHGLTVLADSLLRQLFYNLIDNSLKYGQKITRIRIRYDCQNPEVLKLIYEDDGVGLAVAEKEKLFKEGCGKGTGYGLYLIKRMMEVYGWSIKETGTVGIGAQFTILIPRLNQKGMDNYRLS